MRCPECSFINMAGSDECESCKTPLTHIEALQPKRGMERRILDGLVSNLSPKPALQVSPGESLAGAVEAMRKARIGSVLVIEKGELLGIFSERELLLRGGSGDLNSVSIWKLMRSRPTCLKEEDQVADAFHRMALSGHRHLPVRMKDGSYAVVSARDLLRYLCK
jgi:CBS domain-containing protein